MGMKKYIKLGLLILVMALIFYFSAQPADDSTVQANFVLDIIYKIYSLIALKNPLDYESFSLIFFTPVRKLAHFTEFMVLGIVSYINADEYFDKNKVIISIFFCAIYAVSDEIHQIFVPGRACALLDMCIDTCGACLGIFLIHLVIKRCQRK